MSPHPVFREGLRIALRADPALDVIVDCDAKQIAAVAELVAVDLLVLDVTPGALESIARIDTLRRARPTAHVLCIAEVADPIAIDRFVRARADGHALKSQSAAEIREAVTTVLATGAYRAPSLASGIRGSPGFDSPLRRLTARERQVFELVVQGYSNNEIALALYLSRRTVETHRLHVTHKLAVKSVAELCAIAAVYEIATARVR